MRLLFVDKDRTSARTLHSEFLDYRGVNWSLTHCQDRQQAIQLIEQDSYQCILYHAHQGLDEAEFEASELLQSANCPPVLTISERLSAIEQLLLVQRGCDDCVSRSEFNGSGIMRRLRMTETRNTVWNKQSTEIVHSNWFEAAHAISQDLSGTKPDIASGESDATSSCSSVHHLLDRRLRVAHLYGETSIAERTWLKTAELEFKKLASITELIEHCEENILALDVILIEQSIFEEASPTELTSIRGLLPIIPGVVLTLEKSDFASLSYLERGYSDCLIVDKTSESSLISSLRKAVIRRRRSLVESLSKQQVGPEINDRRASVRSTPFRRRHVRFLTQRPIVVVPVLSNGAPDLQGRCNAETIDVSLGGIGVKIPERDQLPSRNWIIGFEQSGGKTGWINAFLRRVDYQNGELQVGLIFQNDSDDLFHLANLWPSIDGDTKRFETRLPSNILDQWVGIGILERELVRRARVCPECDAVCSVGTGCSQCGCFELEFHDMIHHFACAHVSKTHDFQHKESIRCPKCLRGPLVAGADFELIRSQYTCGHCRYQGDVTAEVGCCLSCQLRFPIEIGREVEIYGYHVERLDVLALVDAAR